MANQTSASKHRQSDNTHIFFYQTGNTEIQNIWDINTHVPRHADHMYLDSFLSTVEWSKDLFTCDTILLSSPHRVKKACGSDCHTVGWGLTLLHPLQVPRQWHCLSAPVPGGKSLSDGLGIVGKCVCTSQPARRQRKTEICAFLQLKLCMS